MEGRESQMKDYKLSAEALVMIQGSSAGTQPKYYDNGYWYKTNNAGYEGLSEYLVSLLLSCSSIKEYVVYEECLVNGRKGCRSKSFLGKDEIPVYGKNDKDARFTGKRIHRGLYKTDDGTVINADMNGSANIMRKCIPDAFRLKELAYDRMIVIKHPMYNAMVSNRNKQKNK